MSHDSTNPAYVVAVSGGVDSMVLLDALAKSLKLRAKSKDDFLHNFQLPAYSFQLVVAHFDHGIRSDSHLDAELVEKVAKDYGLEFVLGRGNLGAEASEAEAREARYTFLREVRDMYEAEAIITAHHEDDVLETAVHNILRGTGRRGLTSLGNTREFIRPLLDVPKSDLVKYAKQHCLTWREDSTNTDTKYKRNYIRHVVLPKLYQADSTARDQLRAIIAVLKELNPVIDDLIEDLLETLQVTEPDNYDRLAFRALPASVQREALMAILRQYEARDVDRSTIDRLLYGIMNLPSRKVINVCHHIDLKVWRERIQIVDRGRETV